MNDDTPATTVAVNYSRDVGWAGSVVMEIQRAGDSTVVATFNDDGKPEIGVWSAPVPPEKLDQLVARLRASGYERLEAPGALMPGMKTLALGQRLAGQSLPVMHVFARPHEPLAPVLAALGALRSAIAAHPLRVLRGHATWTPAGAQVERGGEAIVDVTLTNAGTAPLEMGNPLAVASGWSGIRLAFTKRAQPAGGEQQVDLDAGELHDAPGATPPRPTATLAPGQSLRFQARKKIELAAGSYAVRFEYHNVETRDGDPRFVGGTLQLALGDLTVKRGSWWKVW